MKLNAQTFCELLKKENITYEVRGNHLFFTHDDNNLVNKLYALLDKQPDFEARIIQLIDDNQGMSFQEFIRDSKGAGISIELNGHSLTLRGGKENTRKRFEGILERSSSLKAELILSLAAKNPALLDDIQECACRRWTEGYSDNLFMAVLSNIAPTGEIIEYNDTPDEAQATFLRSMGYPDADIMNRKKHPSVWIKQKPRTDWDAEISKYR